MDESLRLDVVYCEAWDSRSRSIVGPLAASTARERDSAGDPYAVMLAKADGRPHVLMEIAWAHRFARCWYFDEHTRRYLGAEYRGADDNQLTLGLCEAWDYATPDQPEFAKQVRTYCESQFSVYGHAIHRQTSFIDGSFGGRSVIDPEPATMTIPVPAFGDWMALCRLTQPYRLVESPSAPTAASSGVIAQQSWHPNAAVPTDRGRPILGIETLTRTSVRLHPRRGAPTVQDSHLGGPLAWPGDEPWPLCEAGHLDDTGKPREAALVAAGQFRRRDYPSLPFPEGRDLLQVLWCPIVSDDRHEVYAPRVRLVWQDSTRLPEEAVTVLPPVVTEQDERYVPEHACLIDSCAVVEYPQLSEVPREIRDTLSFVDELGNPDRTDDWPDLRWGSKIGGWTPWWQSSPVGLSCQDCGTDLQLLLSLHTDERADYRCSCTSDERQPVGWVFGREGALNIYACTADVTHSVAVGVD